MRRQNLVTSLLLVALTSAFAASASADAHMRTHTDLLFRLGFKGKTTPAFGAAPGTVPADNSFGADLRVDIPVARFVTLGPAFSVYAVRPKDSPVGRAPIVDIDPFLKIRYVAGRKKKIEVYGLFQGGFSMVFLRKSSGLDDRFGLGWNIGITPGVQLLLGRSFGLVTEIGWMRTQGNFDHGELVVNQGVWRVGFVF